MRSVGARGVEKAIALLVLACTSRAEPRGNVTVYEYKIDSAVADIQWVGDDKKTVFVRSQKNFIYRSGDEGRTWERQNWKMEKTSDEEKSGILSLHVSPTDTNKIFFRGAGRQHWLTTDRGQKYVPLELSFTIKEVKMHPTEAEWMLASHLTEGCKKAERVNCAMEVFLTKDLGRTWQLLQRYVAQFEWAPHGTDGGARRGVYTRTRSIAHPSPPAELAAELARRAERRRRRRCRPARALRCCPARCRPARI
jgi:photosystem II stability/assembly factor-like uncharacterized protein